MLRRKDWLKYTNIAGCIDTVLGATLPDRA